MSAKNRKQRRVTKLLVFLILLVVAAACGIRYRDQLLEQGEVVTATFVHNQSKTIPLRLTVARTEADRRTGLMFRKDLPQNTGMLFLHPEEKLLSFWMHNTFVSLDMIFLNAQKKVVGILTDVPILNDVPRTIGLPAQFVVELPAGSSRALNITVGSELVVEKNGFSWVGKR